MDKKLLKVLEILEKEKNISKTTMLEVIENSLFIACKNHFGKADNTKVNINAKTCDSGVVMGKEVVEEIEDPLMQISVAEAGMISPNYDVGDIVQIPIGSKSFGWTATQSAKDIILQKVREKERKSLYNDWYGQEKDIVTGIVQRYLGKDLSINLGKMDVILGEAERVKGEAFQPTERIKLRTLGVKDTPKGPGIPVSRTHPDLVKRLFESEAVEVRNDTVEIKTIAREAGSRIKIVVMFHGVNMGPVGIRVGMNGARINSIANELHGEKTDIITWDSNPAHLVEGALSSTKVICVMTDEDIKEAQVIVPDYQLSLAIGKEGQNARLAARPAGYEIDIKSETQTRESGFLEELGIQYRGKDVYGKHEGGYDAKYQENYQGDYQEEYQGDYRDDNVTE